MHRHLWFFSPIVVGLLPCCALVGGIADLRTDVSLDDAGGSRQDGGADASGEDGANDEAATDAGGSRQDGGDDAKMNAEPACAGLQDGFYCGGHRLQGDPTVLYGCSGGQLVASRQCSTPCNAQPSPPDSCGGDGGDGWPCSCAGVDDNGAMFSTSECGKQFCAADHVYWTCRLAPGDNNAGMVRGTVPCN